MTASKVRPKVSSRRADVQTEALDALHGDAEEVSHGHGEPPDTNFNNRPGEDVAGDVRNGNVFPVSNKLLKEITCILP